MQLLLVEAIYKKKKKTKTEMERKCKKGNGKEFPKGNGKKEVEKLTVGELNISIGATDMKMRNSYLRYKAFYMALWGKGCYYKAMQEVTLPFTNRWSTQESQIS